MRARHELQTWLVLAVLLLAGLAQAASVTLVWDAPTTNTDGSPLTDLGGYRLYQRQQGEPYGSATTIAAPTTTGTASDLLAGVTYCWVVTAYDLSGHESERSHEVCFTVPAPAGPGQATNLVLTWTVQAPQTAPAGLVAHYRFDEGTGTTAQDSSELGHHGTLQGGPIWEAGQAGMALRFDGVDDFVAVPDAPALDLGAQGSMMAWVRLETLGRWHSVIAKGQANTDPAHNYGLEITDTNRIRCILGNGTAALRLDASVSPVTGQFYHLACTWDGSTVRLYINGTLDRSTAQTVTPAANSAPLFIGQFGGNVDRLDGTIDEVRLYHRALNAAEVQAAM